MPAAPCSAPPGRPEVGPRCLPAFLAAERPPQAPPSPHRRPRAPGWLHPVLFSQASPHVGKQAGGAGVLNDAASGEVQPPPGGPRGRTRVWGSGETSHCRRAAPDPRPRGDGVTHGPLQSLLIQEFLLHTKVFFLLNEFVCYKNKLMKDLENIRRRKREGKQQSTFALTSQTHICSPPGSQCLGSPLLCSGDMVTIGLNWRGLSSMCTHVVCHYTLTRTTQRHTGKQPNSKMGKGLA